MTLTELPNDIEALKQLVLDTHQQVRERDEQIARHHEQITTFRVQITERDEQLATYQGQITERDERLAAHQTQIAERDEWLADQEAKIQELQSQLAYLKHKLFGQRSEKIDPQQLLLFKELAARVAALQDEVEQEQVNYTRRQGHGRKPLPDDLPVEEITYPLDDTTCPCCGEPMQPIGEEVTDEVDYHPGSLFLRRHVRPKYACRACQEGVHIAPLPPRPIDKGVAGPGLLAHVLTSKYADHVPLTRLQGMLRRHRLDVSVSSLCDWVARMADLLAPLYEALKAQLLQGHLIQSDDTPVPYQSPELKKRTASMLLISTSWSRAISIARSSQRRTFTATRPLNSAGISRNPVRSARVWLPIPVHSKNCTLSPLPVISAYAALTTSFLTPDLQFVSTFTAYKSLR